MIKTRNIVIFGSGGGSNAQKIIEHGLSSNVKYRVRAIFTDKPKSGIVQVAKDYHIPHFIVDKNYAIEEILKSLRIDLVVLAGYLKKVPDKIINQWFTINIHPSLLPKYGGKGMYGIRVHEAVIKSEDTKTGMTVHHVNSEYDQGKIMFNAEVDINTGDTARTVEKKVRQLEHKYFPLVIDETCRTIEDLIVMCSPENFDQYLLN